MSNLRGGLVAETIPDGVRLWIGFDDADALFVRYDSLRAVCPVARYPLITHTVTVGDYVVFQGGSVFYLPKDWQETEKGRQLDTSSVLANLSGIVCASNLFYGKFQPERVDFDPPAPRPA